MADNAQIIWNFFKSKGLSDCGIAGLMGNLFAESGLQSTNLQNSYENKLGMNDAAYTIAVDSGSYTNFIYDSAGYGLAQWTFWSRKQALYNYCKSKNLSIGSLEGQLEFLYQELTTNYSAILKVLINTDSILEASNSVLLNFEKPQDQSQDMQKRRAEYGQKYYETYHKIDNSSLISYTNITKNKTVLSSKNLNRITIHCFVGQVTAKQGVDYFATTDRQASANYVIGYDGSIGLSVAEKDRSWCSSSSDNDKQSITIEVASETVHPYRITNEAYKALLNLITDICQRHKKTKVIWYSDKTQALNYKPLDNEIILTVHRWFANKACPGDYLFNLHGEIASTVTERLNEGDEDMTQEKFNEMMDVYLKQLAEQPISWEQDAMNWAQNNGLMIGNEQGQLMPKRFITRGELATVLKRYSEKSDI